MVEAVEADRGLRTIGVTEGEGVLLGGIDGLGVGRVGGTGV